MPISLAPQALASAYRTLQVNRRYGVTVPHARMFRGLYLWDTAVIARGIASFDPGAAAAEILAILRAQWNSGMLPNEVGLGTSRSRRWIHGHHQGAPAGMVTSGITQPPTIVRAALEVGRLLDQPDRTAFHRVAVPALAGLCRWVLEQRVGERGLAVVLHPYETGMDNRTDLAEAMTEHWLGPGAGPVEPRRRVALGVLAGLRSAMGDLRSVPVEHRAGHDDVLAAWLQLRHLRRYGYDLAAVRASGRGVLIEDVGYNAVLLDALDCLLELADDAGAAPDDLVGRGLAAARANLAAALAGLWQERAGGGGYASRDHRTGQVLDGDHVASLYPLLVERRPERVRVMLEAITDPARYATLVPLPSAPANSPRFRPERYWQGPSWPFAIDIVHTALLSHGESQIAGELRRRYLTRPHVQEHAEYDNPLTGAPLGARQFSPSAALAIRLALLG